MTKDAKDKDDEKPKPKHTVTDLAKKLDAAVAEREAKHDAMAAAQATLDEATKDYQAAAAHVTDLAGQLEAIIKDILSFGGTVHVA